MVQKYRLPSLNALRAFHAVMQHRSYRAASEELRVTPQAVGQQIKGLEEALKLVLFEQKGRRVEPTEAAIVLSHYVMQGFAEFSEGIRRVTRSTYRDRINLNASPFFATHYLMPVLSLFHDVLPSADLRLTTMVNMPEFERDDIDLGIQWGYGTWPDLEVALLIPDPKVICCTPALAPSVRDPEDLARVTLLDAFKSNRLWPDIFAHLGIEPSRADRKIGFDDAATMRRATLQGIGIGLISTLHADEDIRTGALVAPLGRDILGNMAASDVPGFYLVAPRRHLRAGSVAALFRWLKQQDWSKHGMFHPAPALP